LIASSKVGSSNAVEVGGEVIGFDLVFKGGVGNEIEECEKVVVGGEMIFWLSIRVLTDSNHSVRERI